MRCDDIWHHSDAKLILYAFIFSIFVTLLFLVLWFGVIKVNAAIGLVLGLSIIVSGFKCKSVAMFLGHLGFAISIIGISLTPAYEIEKELSIKVGDFYNLSQYKIKFVKINIVDGPNYLGHKAEFDIYCWFHKTQRLNCPEQPFLKAEGLKFIHGAKIVNICGLSTRKLKF